MREAFLSWLLYWVYRLLMGTWRLQVHLAPEVADMKNKGNSFLIAHWHGDELGILHQIRYFNCVTLISSSRDGQIMAGAIKRFGGTIVRGSSSKKSIQGLKGLVRLAKKGLRPVMAVDGPKGPIYQVKPGVFQTSRLCQLPIVPLSFWCSQPLVLEKSWNKARLPKPFSRVTVYFGRPLAAVDKQRPPQDQELARELADALRLTREKAEELDSQR